jgi:hypothetical protein
MGENTDYSGESFSIKKKIITATYLKWLLYQFLKNKFLVT